MTPHRRAYLRAYLQRPDVKVRWRAYHQRESGISQYSEAAMKEKLNDEWG